MQFLAGGLEVAFFATDPGWYSQNAYLFDTPNLGFDNIPLFLDDIEMVIPADEVNMMPKESNSKLLWVTTAPNGEHVSSTAQSDNAEDNVLYQTRKESILLNCGTSTLFFTLAFLWIWYR